MKIKVILFTTFCMAFAACNLNLDNKETEEKTADAVDIVDASTSNHLAFKGVPIDGTLKQYVARMEKVGFTHIGDAEGVAILQGDFAGYKGCEVYVSTLEGNDVVAKIVVKFPNEGIWRRLQGNYTNLKEMLTEKYGEPSSIKEEFEGCSINGRYIGDDNDRMRDVRMDRCKYWSIYTTEKGEIIVWIEHSGISSTFVCLEYTDKINGGTIKQQAINDL